MPKMNVDLSTHACHNSTCNQSDTIVGKIPICGLISLTIPLRIIYLPR